MENRFLDAGEVVGLHGIHGEVKILPWADSPAFLLQFDTFYLNGKPYAVAASRVHKTCVLAKLDGIGTPEAAVLLRGQTVRIDRADLRLPQGTVFIADLLGCTAFDEEGRVLGIVREVYPSPANDVYRICGEHEYLVPAVKEFVKEINVAEKFIRVRLIEGMATDEN